MKSSFLAGAALSVLVLTVSAQAADLPRRAAPAYAPMAVPVFTWTGFYGGINGGWGFGSFQGRGPALPSDPSGGLIGGTVGYNYQMGNFVFGLEGDLDYAAVNATTVYAGPLTTKSGLTLQDTIRGRVGYAMDRAMFYATGGYAGGNVHTTIYDVPGKYFNAQTNYLNGWALGAGVEYALQPNISAKLEYLYTDLPAAYNFVGSPDVTRVGTQTSNIRAGVNYHF